jgi:sigma-B regulation protein RsbQ
MSVLVRNNVQVLGRGPRTLVFAHGFGCDQTMWAAMVEAFAPGWRVVLFDYVGCGGSDFGAFTPGRYSHLEGYAQDLVEIAQALELRDAVLVGHSVSAMIGVLAAREAPQCFSHLVMVGPSPRYLNEAPDYVGGFEHADIVSLLELMDTNYTAWAGFLSQAAVGGSSQPHLTGTLERSFCAMHPEAARCFAQATFFGDNRADLPHVRQPTLILQCRDDTIAPNEVGAYLHRHIAGSTLVRLHATGHCPHISDPEETIAAVREWLCQQGLDGGC